MVLRKIPAFIFILEHSMEDISWYSSGIHILIYFLEPLYPKIGFHMYSNLRCSYIAPTKWRAWSRCGTSHLFLDLEESRRHCGIIDTVPYQITAGELRIFLRRGSGVYTGWVQSIVLSDYRSQLSSSHEIAYCSSCTKAVQYLTCHPQLYVELLTFWIKTSCCNLQ